jgi:hypothetical protein
MELNLEWVLANSTDEDRKVYDHSSDPRKFVALCQNDWNICWQRLPPIRRYTPNEGLGSTISEAGWMTIGSDEVVIVCMKGYPDTKFPGWAEDNGFSLSA